MSKLLNKEQGHVVKVVNFGNILEWFDVYSFSYLAKIISIKFFPFQNALEGLLLSFEDVPFLVETRVAPHLIQTALACCI